MLYNIDGTSCGWERGVSFNVERVFLDLGQPIIDKMDGILEAVSRELETLLAGFGASGGERGAAV